MMINRREFVVGASTVVATPVLKPILAQADTLPWATYFDTNSIITNNAIIPGIPTAAYDAFVAVSYQPTPSYGISISAQNVVGIGAKNGFVFNVTESSISIYYVINGNDSRNTHYVLWQNSTPFQSPSNGWHTVVAQWNSQSQTARCYHNSVSVPVYVTQAKPPPPTSPPPFQMDFSSLQWRIGGEGAAASSIASIYLRIGTPINIDDILAGFFDYESGYAVRGGSNGKSIIPGVTPQIYLSGPPQIFPLNLAADDGNALSPTRTDTSPSSGFSVIGTLQNASSDPFEPGT